MVLDKDFRIEVDSYNYSLIKEEVTEEINPRTGKLIVSRDQWHYPSLNMALKKYVDEALRPSKSIEEVLGKLGSIYDLIDSKIKLYGKN